jgi:two-component system C4-dicarboxylate transport sensor histidine kinase DctB
MGGLFRTTRSRHAGLVALVVLGALVFLTYELTRVAGIAALRAEAKHKLGLYSTSLRGELAKYEFLPELLATNEALVSRLSDPDDVSRYYAVNSYLENIARIVGASDTYLMDRSGLTVAASNWNTERPFVGKNFSFRPYFQQAMQGRLGRYFALGMTSNKRGYYFAYPVRRGEEILGVIVVKVSLVTTEQAWASDASEFIVTDPDGVVFITTQPDWQFRSQQPLDPEVQRRITNSRRYNDVSLEPLPVVLTRHLNDGARLVTLRSPGQPGRDVEYLVEELEMLEAGWRIQVFSPLQPVRTRSLAASVIGALVLAVLAFGIMIGLQRSRERSANETALRRARDELEERVHARTADLSLSNARLKLEIDERRRAEADLRLAQDELIQAAKLAGLGQMSAGISHELNQPLAAIRSYADNARVLLERQRSDEACWNLQQIAELTARMAAIIRQLKVFAHKSTGQTVAVSVRAALDGALSIVGSAFQRDEAQLDIQDLGADLSVMADMLWLQQVFVNLISNALHAMEDSTTRILRIEASGVGDRVRIAFHDTGTGIDSEDLARLFDPFFTTKAPGQGLGLGLALSYRIVTDMGGTIRAASDPQGGAVFTVELARAAPAENEEVCRKRAL